MTMSDTSSSTLTNLEPWQGHPLAEPGLNSHDMPRVVNSILDLQGPEMQLFRECRDGKFCVCPSWSGNFQLGSASSALDPGLNLEHVLEGGQDPTLVPVSMSELGWDDLIPATMALRTEVDRITRHANAFTAERASIADDKTEACESTQLGLSIIRSGVYMSTAAEVWIPLVKRLATLAGESSKSQDLKTMKRKVIKYIAPISELDAASMGLWNMDYDDVVTKEEIERFRSACGKQSTEQVLDTMKSSRVQVADCFNRLARSEAGETLDEHKILRDSALKGQREGMNTVIPEVMSLMRMTRAQLMTAGLLGEWHSKVATSKQTSILPRSTVGATNAKLASLESKPTALSKNRKRKARERAKRDGGKDRQAVQSKGGSCASDVPSIKGQVIPEQLPASTDAAPSGAESSPISAEFISDYDGSSEDDFHLQKVHDPKRTERFLSRNAWEVVEDGRTGKRVRVRKALNIYQPEHSGNESGDS